MLNKQINQLAIEIGLDLTSLEEDVKTWIRRSVQDHIEYGASIKDAILDTFHILEYASKSISELDLNWM